MATAILAGTTEAAAPRDEPFPITAAMYERMVEHGVIPEGRRVYLWGGRLFEKMAKTLYHLAVLNALDKALTGRLPAGFFVGDENPIRLDGSHMPLPDLVILRGQPLQYISRGYPDGRDVVLVAEVDVSSLPHDLGSRLERYARSLPDASYLVADVRGRRLLLHTGPVAGEGEAPWRYEALETVTPGGVLRLRVGGVDLAPMPFEELLPG